MPLNRESLSTLKEKTFSNYMSLLRPLDKTPRYNILKVLAFCEAGAQHQLLGDIDFLSEQLFPDTASGDYLRMHWSDRVAPLYAGTAAGTIIQKGTQGSAIPAGTVYTSQSGKRYYTDTAYKIGGDGTASVRVYAEAAGNESNIDEGEELAISSAIPTGVETKATVASGGIAGGTDAETDEAYRNRVLLYQRNFSRYGKPGDFAAWAIDSSVEVTKAWEIKGCYGVFGVMLVIVLGGNHFDGINRVANTDAVRDYIRTLCPPVQFTVRSPELVELNPAIRLLEDEDTVLNRERVTTRLKSYLESKAKPGCTIKESTLKSVCADGFFVTEVKLSIDGGDKQFTAFQYPVLGSVRWT